MTKEKVLALVGALALAGASSAAARSTAHAIDTAHSSMTLRVYKSGLFSFAADNHVINAPIASGYVNEPAKEVDLTVNAADIRVLDPQMASDKRAEVQARMLSADVLDVAKYPTISFRSSAVVFDAAGKANVVGDLTMHGQTHPVTVHVSRTATGRYSGSATVSQTAFGITPVRIAGGLVRVQNDIQIDFTIVTR